MPFLTTDGELISIRTKLSESGSKAIRGYRLTTAGDHIIPTYIEPGPLMDPVGQSNHTPFTTLLSARAIGTIPYERSVQLDSTERPYYMQNDAGKLCLTRYTPRVDPNTTSQQSQRQKCIAAVNDWKSLTPEQKNFWKTHPQAKALRLDGYRFYMSQHMRGKI